MIGLREVVVLLIFVVVLYAVGCPFEREEGNA